MDTKILLSALDLLEENRALSPAEATLRCLAAQGIHQDIHSERLAFWRQRFNLCMAVEWDENSRFFHAAVSGRHQKNKISCLEHNGVELRTHEAKSTLLHDFYYALLGRSDITEWKFSLSDLYPHLSVAGLP
jgi:hypothetical protein